MKMYDTIKQEEERQEEIKRFYLQQKTCRKECNYGYKNCSLCDRENSCTIRPHLPY